MAMPDQTPPQTLPSQANGNGANGQHATAPGKKHKLSKIETVQLTRLFDKVGVSADGIYTYNEGWSDERVHAEIKTKAAVSVVKETRRDCGFGHLATEVTRRKLSDMDKLEARVAELERKLAVLVGP